MHEKLMSAVLTRAVARLSFLNPVIRINLGLGIAGKEEGRGRNRQWQIRSCSSRRDRDFQTQHYNRVGSADSRNLRAQSQG